MSDSAYGKPPPADASATAPPAAVYRFERCELRLDTRELFVAGKRQAVRRRVFDLIVHLVRERPRAVPHEELLRAVWQRSEASPSVLARAVMEARRALGDAADEARLIVSVHGVGYRFAAAVGPMLPPADDTAMADSDGAAQARRLVAQARAAVYEGRLDEAQSLAERALAEADAAGTHAEKVRALVTCATLAMRRGGAPAAAKFAAQALQIAKGEGFAPLIAQARVAVAQVHLFAGDLGLALWHLQESRDALSLPGFETELVRCLSMLSLALRHQGDLESGLQVCRRSIELARRGEGPSFVMVDRLNEVLILTQLGDRHASNGLADAARACHEEALQLNTEVLHDLDRDGPRAMRHACLSNRSMVLERLNRIDEAWAAMEACDRERDALTDGHAPLGGDRDQTLRMHRAHLLARRGRLDDALHEIRCALDRAEQSLQTHGLPELYGTATDIAQRAGLLDQALAWARRRYEVQGRLQSGKAASLAAVLAAEMNTEELEAELERARAQVHELLHENDDLRRRLRRFEGMVPVCPGTGLAGAEHLPVAFATAFERARARELPMCVGVLSLENAEAVAALHGAEPLQALQRRAVDVLSGVGDIAHPPIALGGARMAFHIRDLGPARADAVCRELLMRLERQSWTVLGLSLSPRWRCLAADAAVTSSPQACVQQLVAQLGERLAVDDATA